MENQRLNNKLYRNYRIIRAWISLIYLVPSTIGLGSRAITKLIGYEPPKTELEEVVEEDLDARFKESFEDYEPSQRHKQILDSTWGEGAIETLVNFEERRNLYLRATRKLFSELNNEYFKIDDKVLEIGSGLGFLKRNWTDEFNGEWVQLDSSVPALTEAMRLNPNGIYVPGSAYDLPFPDESFDVVIELGCFDVLHDLEEAVKEAYRVLKPDGLFIHLLDLLPDTEAIENDLENKEIPFMTKGIIEVKTSIRSIPEGDLEAFNQEIEVLDLDDPTSFGKYERIVNRYMKRLNTRKYFEEKLVSALSSYFNNIENGKLKASFRGERTEQQRQPRREAFGYSEPFAFLNFAGPFFGLPNSQMGDIVRGRFPAMLNPLPAYHDALYMPLVLTVPSLAEKIEPKVLEVSVMRYAIARK